MELAETESLACVFFAVRRTKKSSYELYEPNAKNRETIEAIAPEGGNFEVLELTEQSTALPKLASALKIAMENLSRARCECTSIDYECYKCSAISEIEKICGGGGIDE